MTLSNALFPTAFTESLNMAFHLLSFVVGVRVACLVNIRRLLSASRRSNTCRECRQLGWQYSRYGKLSAIHRRHSRDGENLRPSRTLTLLGRSESPRATVGIGFRTKARNDLRADRTD